MVYSICKSYNVRLRAWSVFEAFSKGRNVFFFDSSLHQNPLLGRYSIIGNDPFQIVKVEDTHALEGVGELLRTYRIGRDITQFPFCGGVVGFLSYDFGFLLEEKVRVLPKPEFGLPRGYFAAYNSAVIIDHLTQKAHVCVVGFPEKSSRLMKLCCEKRFKEIIKILSWCDIGPRLVSRRRSGQPVKTSANFTRASYAEAVKKAKEYIRRGDIYQVNLSQQFQAKTSLSGVQLYRRLRQASPTCFSVYFDAGEFQILSASPERFLSVRENTVTTRPMKGTRPRIVINSAARRLQQSLWKSPKDKAELLMIVDLERNDLGRVCRYGSVQVEKLREMEAYSTVFQTTATIRGELRADRDRIDLLKACFPGGSITGCPKVRAMEIIEELEPSRRYIYTGTLGYLSFSGDMDSNILIRTVLKRGNNISFGVGGGIVADSVPDREYEETIVKAKGIMLALNASS